jgi:splicing factor 3B subunit 1
MLDLVLVPLLQIMAVPANYKPIIDPARKLMATPTPSITPFYSIPGE